MHVWNYSYEAINNKAKGAFEIISDTLHLDCEASKVIYFQTLTWENVSGVSCPIHTILPRKKEGTDLATKNCKTKGQYSFQGRAKDRFPCFCFVGN